jgi:hypothetical protein
MFCTEKILEPLMRFKVEAYKLSEFLSSKEFDDISIQHNLDKLLKRECDV